MIERSNKSGSSGGFPLPSGYDGIAEAKQLLRSVRSGALGTLAAESGFPFASLTTVATDHNGAPILLLSQLSATEVAQLRTLLGKLMTQIPHLADQAT